MVLQDEIMAFIYDHFPLAKKNKITSNDSLLETGIIDSLGVIEIVGFLAEEKGLEIDEDDLIPENFNTVVSITKLIEKKMD